MPFMWRRQRRSYHIQRVPRDGGIPPEFWTSAEVVLDRRSRAAGRPTPQRPLVRGAQDIL